MYGAAEKNVVHTWFYLTSPSMDGLHSTSVKI